MGQMQGAGDEAERNIHLVCDRSRIPIATPQMTYYDTPSLTRKCISFIINFYSYPCSGFVILPDESSDYG